MSNKNKWQALSMSERAFLIREAVRNGITDIGSIKDTWEHRFDGESDQPTDDNSTILTKAWNTVKGWFSKEEPKYITKDNYQKELSKFRNAFEEYHPQAYYDPQGKKYTIGSGLTYLIDDKGNEIPVKKGQTISKEENDRQIALRLARQEEYARSKTPHWDHYHPELKFQILEAMYNAGNANVWEKSPNYQQALRKYEKAKGWEDDNYDLKDIFQHADWNITNEKWLGVRSAMRRNPQAINPDDYKLIYKVGSKLRDSLRTAYHDKFEKYQTKNSHIFSGEDTNNLSVEEGYSIEDTPLTLAAFLPKDDEGKLLKGQEFRKARREFAMELLDPQSEQDIEWYDPNFTRTNRGLNRVYSRLAKKQKREEERRKLNEKDQIPTIDTREEFTNLKMYADLLRRGDIKKEEIPILYQSHLANNQTEAQQRAYNQYLEEEKYKDWYNTSGWDDLEKAYAVGMSSTIAIPTVSSVAASASASIDMPSVMEILKQGRRLPKQAIEWMKANPKKVGKFLNSIIGSEMLRQQEDQYAQSLGYNTFEDLIHEGLLQGDPLTDDFKGETLRLLYSFLRPDTYVGGTIGYGVDDMFSRAKTTAMAYDFSKLNKYIQDSKNATTTWLQNTSKRLQKEWDNLTDQPWTDYFKFSTEKTRLHQQALRAKGIALDREQLELSHKSYELSRQLKGDTTYKPFYSNKESIIQRMLDPNQQVNRISDTEIQIHIPTKSVQFDPQLKLPDNQSFESIRKTQGLETIYSLKYPTAQGGKPTVSIVETPLSAADLTTEYYLVPDEIKGAIQNELDQTRKLLNGYNSNGTPSKQLKAFGSTVSVTEDILPHISDDVDYITSASWYNKNIKGKVKQYHEQKTRGGITHVYNHGSQEKALDVVIIDNTLSGKADPKNPIAVQLFAKEHPVEFADMLQKKGIKGGEISIPYSAEELIENYDPVVGNIIDTMTALGDKTKHLGRVALFFERAPVDKLQTAITTIGKMKYGRGYIPLDISLFDLSNVSDNLHFLRQIGFQGENIRALASNKARMALVLEEYNQYMSGLYRGERTKPLTLKQWEKMATEWNTKGGNGAGTGKNYVSPGDSGYGPWYSTRQIDVNYYLNTSKNRYTASELFEFYNTLNSETLPEPLVAKLNEVLSTKTKKQKITSLKSDDVHRVITSVARKFGVSPQALIEDLGRIIPYLQGTPYNGGMYRGGFSMPKEGVYFNKKSTKYPLEIVESSSRRYMKSADTNTPFNIESKSYKDRLSVSDKRSRKLTKKYQEIQDRMQDNTKQQEQIYTDLSSAYAKEGRIERGKKVISIAGSLGLTGAAINYALYLLYNEYVEKNDY